MVPATVQFLQVEDSKKEKKKQERIPSHPVELIFGPPLRTPTEGLVGNWKVEEDDQDPVENQEDQ